MRSYIFNPLTSYLNPSASGQTQAVSLEDLTLLPKPESASLWRVTRDDTRVLDMLCPAPQGPLVAAADNLGRVLLLDSSHMGLVRMWKGYRDAQVAWLQPPEGHGLAGHGLLLVLYAPKRQVSRSVSIG